MNVKRILLFCFFSYLISWSIAFIYFSNGGSIESFWFFPIAIGYMLAPGLSTIIVQKLLGGSSLKDIGLSFSFNKWYIVAWLFPAILVVVIILVSPMLPGVEFSSGLEYLTEQINSKVPPQQAEVAIQSLKSFGSYLPVYLMVGGIFSALIAGPTINAIPALGEELGWRGFLQKELSPLGFWRSSITVGVIWGLWHLPLIIYGYNYPNNPSGGIFMMILLTVNLSPIIAHVRLLADSVLAAAVLHGVFNALTDLPLLFTSGGNPIKTGVTGATGIFVLLCINIGLFFYRNNKT